MGPTYLIHTWVTWILLLGVGIITRLFFDRFYRYLLLWFFWCLRGEWAWPDWRGFLLREKYLVIKYFILWQLLSYMWRTRGSGKRARKLNFDIFVNLPEIRCFLLLNPLFVFILLQMVKETWLFNQSFHFELSSSWLGCTEQKRWGRDKYFRRSPCLKRVGKTPCLNAVVGIWGRISKNSHFVNCASCDMTSYRDRTGDKWNDRRLRKLLFLNIEEF